jgi:uncharacterized protein YkwD
MLIHSFVTNFYSSFKNSACKLNLLLVASLLFCASASAQKVELQPVSRLLDARAGESSFPRPRGISTPVLDNSETAATHPFSFQQATLVEQTAFELTNQARIANGLLPLSWDAELCRLARNHSEDMGRRGYFDHETPEGLRPRERARASGYRFRVIAENIAYNKGYLDPAALAVDRWMNSSGHRANILYNRFQYSAIGSYVASDGSVYLTQVFVSR